MDERLSKANPELQRARELLDNPRVVWHSLNGFDIGAAIGILEQGIKPYAQFGGRLAVSLSLSPADPTQADHPTFRYYVPRSISFPVPYHGGKIVHSDSHDELQYEEDIPRNEIYGVMIPELFASARLSALPLLKPFNRSRLSAYIERQKHGLQHLGMEVDVNDDLADLKKRYFDVYDDYDARKIVASDINRFVLSQYETAVGRLSGYSEPTLRQTINYLAEKNGIDPLVLPAGFKA